MKQISLRKDELAWKEIERELVAVDVRSSTYLSANQSGTLLWRRLAAGATRDDLVDELVGEFGIDRERAGADVGQFLAELAAQGLLED
jgi:hypothetical protein